LLTSMTNPAENELILTAFSGEIPGAGKGRPRKSTEEKKATKRAYGVARREALRAYNKAYRAAHPEKWKAYYAAHPEKWKAYYAAHREERKAYCVAHRKERAAESRHYHAAHPEKRRARKLKKNYNLSLAEYENILIKQGGVCAICRKRGWNLRRPHIDHDHITNKVRGILCSNCNTALGLIAEDPKRAWAMASYLEKFNEGDGSGK